MHPALNVNKYSFVRGIPVRASACFLLHPESRVRPAGPPAGPVSPGSPSGFTLGYCPARVLMAGEPPIRPLSQLQPQVFSPASAAEGNPAPGVLEFGALWANTVSSPHLPGILLSCCLLSLPISAMILKCFKY